MQIHHPSLDTLADYSSGGLRLSHALCISTHLEYCSACKAQVKQLELIGGQIFNAQPRSELGDTSIEPLKQAVFDKLFADTQSDDAICFEPKTPTKLATQSKQHDSGVPKSLGQFIGSGFDKLVWTRLSPSIKLATLCNDQDGSQIAVSCVKPGGKMPHHSHTGKEITVVLEGSFSDEDGIYTKGDFISRNAKDKHKPIVTKDAECICLMVLDSPIEFTGLFTRLLNPLLKRNHYKNA